jgi:hypothetical protein
MSIKNKLKLLSFIALTLGSVYPSQASLITVAGQFAVTSSSSSSLLISIGDIYSFSLSYEDSLLDTSSIATIPFEATGLFIYNYTPTFNLTLTKVSGSGTYSGSIVYGQSTFDIIHTNGFSDVIFESASRGVQLLDPDTQAGFIKVSYDGPIVINDTGTGQTLRNHLGNQSLNDINWSNGNVSLSLYSRLGGSGRIQGSILNVPEPSTLCGLVMGLLTIVRRRRKS